MILDVSIELVKAGTTMCDNAIDASDATYRGMTGCTGNYADYKVSVNPPGQYRVTHTLCEPCAKHRVFWLARFEIKEGANRPEVNV